MVDSQPRPSHQITRLTAQPYCIAVPPVSSRRCSAQSTAQSLPVCCAWGGFAKLARGVELDAHPHMLRHADGGALAQRVSIHQLPQTAPRVAELIEGVLSPTARDELRCRHRVGRSEIGAKSGPRWGVTRPAATAFPQVKRSVAGPGFEPG